MYPVAILAGGLATRLRPITETIPKALVQVAGEPFIIHQLRYLSTQGIDRVVICIGYLGEMIRDVVGDGLSTGVKVTYSEDGVTLRGTGGALVKALPMLGENFFVLYGDSFLPVDFPPIQRSFERSGKPGLMTVLANKNQWDRSNVLFWEGKLIEYNKASPRAEMSYIDYGLGVLSSSVLKNWMHLDSFDLADVYHALSKTGELEGYEVTERFYEIGSHQGLSETEYYLRKGR